MAKQTKKWSSKVIIKFLEAYEQHPCLWNHKLPSYKDRMHREAALRKIVEVMSDLVDNFDMNSAKAKIRSIRNAYTLEHHKVLKSYKTATSTDEIYRPAVNWFPVADRFLKGIVETKKNKDNNTLIEKKYLPPQLKISEPSTSSNNLLMKQSAQIGHYLKETTRTLPTSTSFDEDEFIIMGKRFAYQLRAMTEHQRLLAEMFIGDIMYYGRSGQLTENFFQKIPKQTN